MATKTANSEVRMCFVRFKIWHPDGSDTLYTRARPESINLGRTPLVVTAHGYEVSMRKHKHGGGVLSVLTQAYPGHPHNPRAAQFQDAPAYGDGEWRMDPQYVPFVCSPTMEGETDATARERLSLPGANVVFITANGRHYVCYHPSDGPTKLMLKIFGDVPKPDAPHQWTAGWQTLEGWPEFLLPPPEPMGRARRRGPLRPKELTHA